MMNSIVLKYHTFLTDSSVCLLLAEFGIQMDLGIDQDHEGYLSQAGTGRLVGTWDLLDDNLFEVELLESLITVPLIEVLLSTDEYAGSVIQRERKSFDMDFTTRVALVRDTGCSLN